MERVDIAALLRRYMADGFPLPVLSNITRISEDALAGISQGKTWHQVGADPDRFGYLVIFLTTMYLPLDDAGYYGGLADSLTTYFGIPFSAVAGYVGAGEEELRQFLAAPLSHEKQAEFGMRICHLFTQFIRDPRFSIEQIDFGQGG